MGNKLFYASVGALAGLINGLAGTGGGIIAVSAFKQDMQQKNAQATSVMIMTLLSAVSICFRLPSAQVFNTALAVTAGGVIGGVIGARLLMAANDGALRIMFAVAAIAAGIRLLI